ncbi:hypothetical protein [Chryseobacterium sp. CT-SW4]|uniref:hypothetical protein n=1 Tax=Chryseobacterium sp. SW-1 TaxID=3157343 RepID=UPI003B0151DF
MKKLNFIPLLQGIYYLITSVWPLIHLKSFLEVTGDKTDIWLVKTVAVLLLSYSFLFFYIAFCKRILPIHALIGSICSIGLAIIDLYYYLQGTLKWVYFLDFIIELCFFIYWLSYLIYHMNKSTNQVKNT